jgi:hypothetical protein
MTNDALFVKVLAQIEKHPETWTQSLWRCSSGMCFAGWACDLTGAQWCAAADSFDSDEILATSPQEDSAYDWDGRWCVPPESRAAAVLGLASAGDLCAPRRGLFNADNSLDDLYRISAEHMGIDAQVLRDKVRAEAAS